MAINYETISSSLVELNSNILLFKLFLSSIVKMVFAVSFSVPSFTFVLFLANFFKIFNDLMANKLICLIIWFYGLVL